MGLCVSRAGGDGVDLDSLSKEMLKQQRMLEELSDRIVTLQQFTGRDGNRDGAPAELPEKCPWGTPQKPTGSSMQSPNRCQSTPGLLTARSTRLEDLDGLPCQRLTVHHEPEALFDKVAQLQSARGSRRAPPPVPKIEMGSSRMPTLLGQGERLSLPIAKKEQVQPAVKTLSSRTECFDLRPKCDYFRIHSEGPLSHRSLGKEVPGECTPQRSGTYKFSPRSSPRRTGDFWEEESQSEPASPRFCPLSPRQR
mmetsp:Transcript_55136/g.124118  ORF Transcript_55136/g.124118 Transcript_55136/m.124118 type:complete len:252 (+) Transcript_55136:87-842(+)